MGSRRILLVEDEGLIALCAQEVLVQAGYDVAGPALRLNAALELAETQSLDAAVLDINLAGEPVWPVAEILHRRGIPFLLLSGYSTELAVPAACNGAPRLRKPFSYDALLDVLGRLLQR